MKESQLLKADSASKTNKEVFQQKDQQHHQPNEEKTNEPLENGPSSINEENNSKDEDEDKIWSRKNLVMEQLKQLESSNGNCKDQRGLNGCKSSRTRSKSTEGVVGTLSKTFEDSSRNGITYNAKKCTSTSVTTSSTSKCNEQQQQQQAKLPSVSKEKPIPPAKPASLVRFPVSPAGTLGRVRRSDAF